MTKGFMLAGALACAMLGVERADACATVTFSPATISINNWDPLNGLGAPPASVTVRVQRTIKSAANDPNMPRSIRLILLDSNSGTPLRLGSAGPRYEVANGTPVISFPLGTNVVGSTAPTVNLANGAGGDDVNISLTYRVLGNTAQEDFVGNAQFSEALTFAAQCFTSNNGGGTAQTAISGAANTINLTIPKLVSIVTASPQTLNFGNFTTAEQQLNISLKSTSNINVAVATQNNNQLVLAGAPTPLPTNSVIAYTMTLNGKTIANGSSLSNEARAGVAGASWPFILSLTGGLPAGKVAGTYSDTITLTLTPN